MKKKLVWVVAAAVLVQSVVAPKKAHAVFGILGIGTPAGIPMIVAGGVLTAGSAVLYFPLTIACALSSCNIDVVWGLEALAFVGGVLLLDDRSEGYLRFSALTAEEAAQIGVTDSELAAYNSSIDEINAVTQSVTSELMATKTRSYNDAHGLWLRYQEVLPNEAFSALTKVSEHLFKALTKVRSPQAQVVQS